MSDAVIQACKERMAKLGRPSIGSILELQRAFGFREMEAIRAGRVETLSRWLRELQERGYVCVVEGTKGGRQREVRPADPESCPGSRARRPSAARSHWPASCI
jgi:hypothetical protein